MNAPEGVLAAVRSMITGKESAAGNASKGVLAATMLQQLQQISNRLGAVADRLGVVVDRLGVAEDQRLQEISNGLDAVTARLGVVEGQCKLRLL